MPIPHEKCERLVSDTGYQVNNINLVLGLAATVFSIIVHMSIIKSDNKQLRKMKTFNPFFLYCYVNVATNHWTVEHDFFRDGILVFLSWIVYDALESLQVFEQSNKEIIQFYSCYDEARSLSCWIFEILLAWCMTPVARIFFTCCV